jgi:hypothetical protein
LGGLFIDDDDSLLVRTNGSQNKFSHAWIILIKQRKKDKWLRNYSFQQQYLSLYNLVRRRSATVESVLSTVHLNISFQRFLTPNNLRLWNDLVRRIVHIRLNDQKDVLTWNLHQNSLYTVRSLYHALINNRIARIKNNYGG